MRVGDAVSLTEGWTWSRRLLAEMESRTARSMECVPGSYVKECVMLDEGPLECTTTECDWTGRWKEKTKEIFN